MIGNDLVFLNSLNINHQGDNAGEWRQSQTNSRTSRREQINKEFSFPFTATTAVEFSSLCLPFALACVYLWAAVVLFWLQNCTPRLPEAQHWLLSILATFSRARVRKERVRGRAGWVGLR